VGISQGSSVAVAGGLEMEVTEVGVEMFELEIAALMVTIICYRIKQFSCPWG
jgi:preprotein translocase subunit YajC